MSVDKRGDTIKIWDGAIEFERPIDNASTKAFKAEIETRLVALNHHKQTLLSLLRDAYDAPPKTEPFDNDKSWFGIEGLARQYFARESVKREALSNADRKARYRAISDAFQRARSLIEEAAQSPDLADDLIWTWWEETKEYADAAGRFVDLLYIEREFDKVVKGLAPLEAAAVRAADEVHQGRGRPRGTVILPLDFVVALAEVYRKSTESKPGAGDGPFARFVCAFLEGVNRNLDCDTVVDLIKTARRRAIAASDKWGPSAFED